MGMTEKKVKILVADSVAFIRNSQMQNIAEVVYTLRSVVDEIKDAATKQRLRVLPYEIKMIEPSSESIHFVMEFAKKTGDYASLSATDIEVMALTYQLEIEANGQEHLNKEPKFKKTLTMGSKPPPSDSKVEKVAGFFMPKIDQVEELTEQVEEITLKPNETPDKENQITGSDEHDNKQVVNENEGKEEEKEEEDGEQEEGIEEDREGEEEEEEEEEEDDDDDGWITPGNIQQAKNSMNGVLETVQLDVACLTTDFAMQNVLMQIGLNVVSLEGRLIHEVGTC